MNGLSVVTVSTIVSASSPAAASTRAMTGSVRTEKNSNADCSIARRRSVGTRARLSSRANRRSANASGYQCVESARADKYTWGAEMAEVEISAMTFGPFGVGHRDGKAVMVAH